MKAVFLLWHSRETGDGESDDKLIGVFSSAAKAEVAIVGKRDLPGLHDHPDGFTIDRYELDEEAWGEGFAVGPDTGA